MQGGQGYMCDLLAGTFIYRKLNLLYLNQDRRPDGSTLNELVRIYNRSYFGLLTFVRKLASDWSFSFKFALLRMCFAWKPRYRYKNMFLTPVETGVINFCHIVFNWQVLMLQEIFPAESLLARLIKGPPREARPELKQECRLVEKLVTFEQTLLWIWLENLTPFTRR